MGYENSWEPRGFVRRFFGRITAEEILHAVTEVEADPRFDDPRFAINDLLHVDGLLASADHMHEVSAIDRAAAISNWRIKAAIVATRPDILQLAEHYARSPLNPFPARVFATLALARSGASRAAVAAAAGAAWAGHLRRARLY